MDRDYLLLKWGTLKDWSGVKTPEAKLLIKKYLELGSSASAIYQKDTNKQKEIICQIIDACDGKIQNDFDGKYYTKKQAKQYIRNY